MTALEGGLLLLGLFGVPVGLLVLSHRFRNLGRRARGAFWGGLLGYGIGLAVWLWSTLGPVVMWDATSARLAGVVLPLAGCAAAGALVGTAIGRTPRRGPKAPGRKRRKGPKAAPASPPPSPPASPPRSPPGRTGETASVVLTLILAGAAPAGAAPTVVAPTVAASMVAQPPEDIFVVRDIDAGVILAETAPGVSPSAYAASVAVLGSEGVLLVDTFHGPTAAGWFLDRIAERTDAPVRWVVNTHRHGDHVWGNAAVLERFPEAEIVAHPATKAWLESDGAAALETERARLDGRIASIETQLAGLSDADERRPPGEALLARTRAQRAEVERVRPVPPTTAVPDFRRIELGTRAVWIQPLGAAHTDGDVAVWIDGILVAGDVVEEGLPWIEDADIAGWATTLDALARRGPALVIAGHGGLSESDDRAALLHLQRDALASVVATARTLAPGAEVTPDGFAALRAEFAEWGVGREAFDAWIVAAVAAAR